jgi:hypothetical protein
VMVSVCVKRLIVCLFLVFSLSGTVFGQASALILNSTDIRMEYVSPDDVDGFNLYIRKKPEIESVMLTEASGAYALRDTKWNPVNGNERRAVSGVILNDADSLYSIVSSTPQPDEQFGMAFHLFVPQVVVYGNPTTPTGTVYLAVTLTSQINIRTFDQKYADPNRSRFQNNYFTIISLLSPYVLSEREARIAITPRDLDMIDIVRDYLKILLIYNKFLDSINNDELKLFLINIFREKDLEQQRR